MSLNRRLVGILLPVALAAVLPWLSGLLRSDLDIYDQRDETLFHLPTVRAFAAGLPLPDLSDYPSATGPLYHLLLAPLALLSDELLPLRLATLALSAAMIALAGALLARSTVAPIGGLALALAPLALSPYVIGPAVRLSTDNAALLWVVACLLVLDGRPEPGGRRLLLAAALATAAVLTRQVHGWLVLVLAVAAWRSGETLASGLPRLLLAALPAFGLAPLVLLWGGLAPPSFAEHQGGLPAHVALTELALIGAFSLAWAPWLRGHLRPGAALAGAGLPVLLILVDPMPFVEDPLRYGGSLWRLASRLPDLGGTNPAILLLAPWGGAALSGWLRRARRQGDRLAALALPAFLLANLASARAYQKYYEPFLLLVVAWIATRGEQPRAWAWGLPAALALAWWLVAVGRFLL